VDELKNPYRPGAGTAPPALVGRDALLDHFGVLMRRAIVGRPGKSVMPIGLRGVGKTVLLNRFASIASHEGLKVVSVESPEDADLRALLARSLRKVLLGLDRSTMSSKLTRALRVLKSFSATTPDGLTLRLDVDSWSGLADSGDFADDLTDLLIAVGEALAERRSGLLLCIDEVQYVTAEALGALISAIHRTVQADLPVVLVGAGLPQLPGLAGDAKSYAERLFEFPLVDSLSPDDAQAALIRPAEERGVTFDSAAQEAVLKATAGYPYFIQEWGYHLWNAAPEPTVTGAMVDAIEPRIIKHLDENFFLVRFDRLTPKEKDYLRAMATLGPGPHRSGDIARQLQVKVESVAPRRGGLIGKGMIYSPAHGDTAFTVPMFDRFLVRQMPNWSP
jgi:GTPase SAR1 family protein